MKELGKVFKTKIADREIEVCIGKYSNLSNGQCFISCGETTVMVNVAMAKYPRSGVDFFPLGVDYEEKMYTIGKIPGGFKKREGRPADKAILVSRLIDRPLRPLFPKGFYNDVTVTATPISVDPDIAPEILSMIGSSIALSISDIPFDGPTGAINIGYINDKYIINPTLKEKEYSILDLTVSGTADAVLMVEAGANQVSEELMLEGIMLAHEEIKKQVKFINEIVKECGKTKVVPNIVVLPKEIEDAVNDFANEKMDVVLSNFGKEERDHAEELLDIEVLNHFAEIFPEGTAHIKQALYNMKKYKVRSKILNDGVRPDGRDTLTIRPIWCENGILPRVHGSAVFTRGLTQVMTTLTLGMLNESQHIEGLDNEESKRYMHHYNFPAYSVGEARPARSPGRREIGHGALAERALLPVLPSEEEFPYCIRTVSEVLSSNGSTSQASVCGSTLALMDGGVPISSPVAGIAMGLIKDKDSDKVAILSDIQGLEDFLGDMDFKVAGTHQGITAIQMDMKIHGIDRNILKTALEQARLGRIHILGKMLEVLPNTKTVMSKYVPKIISFNINPDKIRDVIGAGGKVINDIIEKTGVKIDIEDSGRVMVAHSDETMIEKAKKIIERIVFEMKVEETYTGKVVRITEFGAFVEVNGKDGMIHISKLSDKRVEKVEDVVILGDTVEVKIIKVDEKGRVDMRLLKKI